jgi:hypothetical protein
MHFQYFGEFSKRPEGQGDLTPTMSLQGSFFMLTREKYWELNICDEEFGSWGQQGVEVACKTWLSGGQVMVNQTTWYAHMFRTQGGDFGFPYHQSGRQVDHARKYSRELFLDNNWPQAKHDLQWLIDKFSPVPYWPSKQKGIIYYTDNQLPIKMAKRVQRTIKASGLPIVSASLKPMDKMGKNIHLPLQRGKLTMFKQQLAALEALDTDYVFFCEHDVLYPKEHFDFTPPTRDRFYYNHNWWKIGNGDLAVHWDADQVSGLCCDRKLAVEWYRKMVENFDEKTFDRKYEPESGTNSESWKSSVPLIDIRHSHNLTYNKWQIDDFRNKDTAVNFEQTTIDKIAGWENLQELI